MIIDLMKPTRAAGMRAEARVFLCRSWSRPLLGWRPVDAGGIFIAGQRPRTCAYDGVSFLYFCACGSLRAVAVGNQG